MNDNGKALYNQLSGNKTKILDVYMDKRGWSLVRCVMAVKTSVPITMKASRTKSLSLIKDEFEVISKKPLLLTAEIPVLQNISDMEVFLNGKRINCSNNKISNKVKNKDKIEIRYKLIASD
jgi:hypothetical protein